MGHGNTSDVVAIALIVAGANFVFFQDNLTKTLRLPGDVGSLKPLLSGSVSEDERALLTLMGGFLFILGGTFSAVKWNKRNGTMTFLGCAIAAGTIGYRTFESNEGVFDPMSAAYALAAFLLLGGLHTRFFPSNHALPKNLTKNNHGNASDRAALSLLALSIVCMAKPKLFFDGIGPISGSFRASSQTTYLIQLCGALIFVFAMMLSAVKWNRVNGKLPGLFCALTAALVARDATFTANVQTLVNGESNTTNVFFAFRFALVLLLLYGGIHIFAFPSNPLVKWKDVSDAVKKSKKKETKKEK